MTTELHIPSTVTASAQVAPFYTKNQKLDARANIVAAKFVHRHGFMLRFVLEHPLLSLLTSGSIGMIVGLVFSGWL